MVRLSAINTDNAVKRNHFFGVFYEIQPLGLFPNFSFPKSLVKGLNRRTRPLWNLSNTVEGANIPIILTFCPLLNTTTAVQEYDFIGVTERMDETAVALQMILGLPTASVLYISSKVNGGYDDAGLYNSKCYFIQPSFYIAFMKQYFESKEWNDKIKWSIAVHQAVNRSLDLTIDALGRNEFQEQLQKFRRAQAIVTRTCADSALLPCSATGQRHQDSETNCLFYDLGCNFECLDRVSNEMNLW
jgi:hypothetical protein